MAMTIFLVLNGMGIVFLLYVLANFWKEGHRPRNNARKYAAEFGRRDWAAVLVVTHPISHGAQGSLSVVPFRVRGRFSDKPISRASSDETSEAPVGRFSTR